VFDNEVRKIYSGGLAAHPSVTNNYYSKVLTINYYHDVGILSTYYTIINGLRFTQEQWIPLHMRHALVIEKEGEPYFTYYFLIYKN